MTVSSIIKDGYQKYQFIPTDPEAAWKSILPNFDEFLRYCFGSEKRLVTSNGNGILATGAEYKVFEEKRINTLEYVVTIAEGDVSHGEIIFKYMSQRTGESGQVETKFHSEKGVITVTVERRFQGQRQVVGDKLHFFFCFPFYFHGIRRRDKKTNLRAQFVAMLLDEFLTHRARTAQMINVQEELMVKSNMESEKNDLEEEI
eukprot:snap_masked-scaffold_84-processed-gene-0.14-mRNA-1 protein AED:1.00 eAED:1.00 QI:0/-1/0/0/-1/1/1/0/201